MQHDTQKVIEETQKRFKEHYMSDDLKITDPEGLGNGPVKLPGPVAGYELVETNEDAVLLCALLCHNVTKALNDSVNEYTVPWEQSRDSAIAGVKALVENPKLTPAEQHQQWLDYKYAEGWVYGAIKDPKAKTHPCLLPYEALPAGQKVKDAIFGAIVRTFFGLEGA